MPETIARRNRIARPSRWTSAFLIALAWLAVVALAVRKLPRDDRIVVAISGFGAAAITFCIVAWAERARWRSPIAEPDEFVHGPRRHREIGAFAASSPDLASWPSRSRGSPSSFGGAWRPPRLFSRPCSTER